MSKKRTASLISNCSTVPVQTRQDLLALTTGTIDTISHDARSVERTEGGTARFWKLAKNNY